MHVPMQHATSPHFLHSRAVQPPAHPSAFCMPRDVSSRFGARVRSMRLERHMTQLQMAVQFGIDRTFISDVERGRKSVSLQTMEIMALGFRVSLSELLKEI